MPSFLRNTGRRLSGIDDFLRALTSRRRSFPGERVFLAGGSSIQPSAVTHFAFASEHALHAGSPLLHGLRRLKHRLHFSATTWNSPSSCVNGLFGNAKICAGSMVLS